MPDLKLAKLPDRTPVKLTIVVSPELNKALLAYADAYNQAYETSEPEPVSELVPYMLQSFLDSDKGFARARKARSERDSESSPTSSHSRVLRRQA